MLKRPPIVLTDIKTDLDAGGIYIGGPERNRLVSMCALPNAFEMAAYKGGIAWAYTGDFNVPLGSAPQIRLAFHKPYTLGYLTNWRDAGVGLSSGVGNSDEGDAHAILAAQRQGRWVYLWAQSSRENFEAFRLWRFSRQEYFFQPYDFDGGFFTNFTSPFNAYGPNADIHVGDTEPPGLWFVSGEEASFTLDDGTSMGLKNPFLVEGTYYSGAYGAFLQRYPLPNEDWGWGPILVFPWASGNYRSPELWFFQRDVGNRMKIYRSRFKRFQWLRDEEIILSDDEEWLVERYPTFNPYGYAFEHNWFDEAHYVGTVGPFYGVDFDGQLQFKVMRDRRRRALLHLVVTTSASSPSVGSVSWNGIYFSDSPDDGARWGRVRQISPYPQGQQTPPGALDITVSAPTRRTAMRSKQGHTLVNVRYGEEDTASPGLRVAAVADGVGAGGGRSNKEQYVYKRSPVVTEDR